MCIRTLYGKNKRIIGLSINGRQFVLSREVCNALRMEELRNQKELKLNTQKADIARKDLEKELFQGESYLLDVEVSFGDSNQINSKTARVEFKNRLSSIGEDKRLEYTELLENFLQALNKANRKRHIKTQNTIRSIVYNTQEAS